MVLSTTKRTSSVASIVNQNQGGGNKKAGFPYIVGRDSWVSRFIRSTDPIHGKCCKRGDVAQTMVFTRNTVRPIGNDARIPMR